MLQIKRAYDLPESPAKSSAQSPDGYRILVDRLWPRGVSKAKAHIDLWLKAIAPSNSLRKWFGHDPERWAEFQKRYRAELRSNPEPIRQLKQLVKEHTSVTLVYSARDETHNQAVVLLALLQGGSQAKSRGESQGESRGKSQRKR